jgi:hypothetical protein
VKLPAPAAPAAAAGADVTVGRRWPAAWSSGCSPATVDLKYTLADVLAVLLMKARAPRREKLMVAAARTGESRDTSQHLWSRLLTTVNGPFSALLLQHQVCAGY